MTICNKKIGIGTIALPLFIIGIILVGQYIYYAIGDDILSLLNLREATANFHFGNSNAIYFSLIFTIPSVVLGFLFKEHFGAKSGRTLSLFLIGSIIAFNIGYKIGFNYLVNFII